jgi:hypothetical protein
MSGVSMNRLAAFATIAAVLAFVAFLLCLAVGSATSVAPTIAEEVAEWEHLD